MHQRDTGIEAIGEAPWGTHVCQLFARKDELIETHVPFFKAGLESGELCVWVTAPPLSVGEAGEALAAAVSDFESYRQRGRMQILPHSEWYLAQGRFDSERVLGLWRERLNVARSAGCAGLRASGSVSWLGPSERRQFAAYEAAVDALVSSYPMLAICAYPLDQCGALQMVDILKSHQLALLKREGGWEIVESGDWRRRREEQARAKAQAEAGRAQGEGACRADQASVRRHLNRILSPATTIGHLELDDLIDVPTVQSLLEELYALAPIPLAIIDTRGKVLVGVGWQEVCSRFHRVHPEACRHCVESDTRLAAGIELGQAKVYKCENNMWDAATPIIVAGHHVGNVFTGQFFFDDEPIDHALFRAQARRYGFDEERYAAAIEAVPRLSRETVEHALAFLVTLAQTLSQSSLSSIKLARAAAERERLMRSLQESRERLNHAQAIAHLGSWELDLVSHQLTWSDEVYRIFGLTPQEFGATYDAFLAATHPEDRDAVSAAYAASVIDKASSYEMEHRIVRPRTGEVRWVHEKCEHTRDDNGVVVRSLGMVLDITERKEAELALRKAKEVLEEADRRKNDFLAVLSHELRNPLAPIRNSLHILERATRGGEQARRAQAVIDRQTGQLARLVDDLLDLTRISRNKVQLRRQHLELNELVRRTLDDYRSTFEARAVSLQWHPASAAVYVDGDWNRLAQVVGNLLQNAAKFTEAGGSTTVTVTSDRAAGEAAIEVADTGVGMTAELLARLFQPFMQADTTLERSKGGLGLGLALVKSLVDLHGGAVRAHSDGLGRGVRFTVTLPLVSEAQAVPLAVRDIAEPGGRRVLIIEDNQDAADSLRELLELDEHRVEVAYDGLQGVAKAREFKPEVVLCDIGLPGVDGYEVARILRAEETLVDAYLVALSGYALPEDVEKARAAGFHDHLAKPPSLVLLSELLTRAPARLLTSERGVC